MYLSSVRSDSLDLVDYSGSNGPIENVGGNHDDINTCNTNYFQPTTDKHNHPHPEDRESVGFESTIPQVLLQ